MERRGLGSVSASLALLAALGCGGDEDKSPIKVGLLLPTSGALGSFGTSAARVAAAAREELNEKGGINGHDLVFVPGDTATDPATAAAEFTRLVTEEDVVAVIGPVASSSVAQVFPIARDAKVPMISPTSTAPSLAMADDDGYMFRNVPNDNVQGIALAYYLTDVLSPPVTQVAIIFEMGPYGEGMSAAFRAAFEGGGGTVIGEVGYQQNMPGTNAAAADAVIDGVKALSPTPPMTVLVALEQDAAAILTAWDTNPGTLSTMAWALTDGARTQGFLDANLPAALVGTRGTAPAFPTSGDAYGAMAEAYSERNTDDIGEQVFAPNLWDAVYLVAAALATQSFAGQEFGGEGLRDALNEVSRAPGVTLHAGQWVDLLSTLRSGGQIDYDGASGPNDFDANGESVGPYEVWELAYDAGSGGLTFVRFLFLEAQDIQSL
jgi:branched-chain amino acid transport system substrate-binding protein